MPFKPLTLDEPGEIIFALLGVTPDVKFLNKANFDHGLGITGNKPFVDGSKLGIEVTFDYTFKDKTTSEIDKSTYSLYIGYYDVSLGVNPETIILSKILHDSTEMMPLYNIAFVADRLRSLTIW